MHAAVPGFPNSLSEKLMSCFLGLAKISLRFFHKVLQKSYHTLFIGISLSFIKTLLKSRCVGLVALSLITKSSVS